MSYISTRRKSRTFSSRQPHLWRQGSRPHQLTKPTHGYRSPTIILHSGLKLAIDAIFHLRSRAADLAVAHLEIACDAALSYANDYNELHPE